MQKRRRVVVTGVGVITPIGSTKASYWSNLLAGTSGVSQNDLFDCCAISSRVIARVRDFNAADHVGPDEIDRTDRFVHFAAAAVQQAMADARIEIAPDRADRAGVFFGSGVGGIGAMIAASRAIYDGGMAKISANTMPMIYTNMAAGYIARMVGCKGPSVGYVTACASSTNALGGAFRSISRGEVDVAVSGGSEAALNQVTVAAFSNMRALSCRNDHPTQASRPFDRDRDGFVPSEGAGALILESLEHALERRATIYGEIVGYGTTNDAFDMVQPSPGGRGAAAAMSTAINDAGLRADEIDYINPHATSTSAGDAAENAAIKSVFGDHAYDLAISATKSMTGHMIGAAGAVEAISTLMAINDSILPPTINLENPDVDCDLNYVPLKAIEKQVSYAISNSFGFGGHNASIVLAKYKEREG